MENIDLKQEIRVLTIKQPFAELMLHGKIETRSWPTNYRGLVLLHAGSVGYKANELLEKCAKEQLEKMEELGVIKIATVPVRREPIQAAQKLNHYAFPGHAFAIATLVDCRPMELKDEEKCFIAYQRNLYCHIYENVRPIVPFALRGFQGFGSIHDHVKKLITLSSLQHGS